jgi:hypothetical protein
LSATQQVEVNNLVYTTDHDRTTVYWAVITGGVTDEIFDDFYAPGFAVELTRSDLGTRTTDSGLFAITGYPQQSFPQLSTTSYVVDLVLSAPGFQDFPLAVTIPVNATFPVAAPAAAMRRLPVRIQGRVVNDATSAAASGALIASVDNPAAHTTALRSPLYFAHASGASVQSVTMTTVLTPSLTQDANAGTTGLNLSNRTGLAANSIVRLSNAAKTLMEYAVVDHLGSGAAAAPGQAFLRNALNRTYAVASTTVEFVTATVAAAGPTLATDASVGDGVLLATQLFTGTVVVESGSAAVAEYHEIGAISDANGFYGLDGMGRVREIFLQATQGTLKQTTGWFLEYDQPINLVDFRIQ